MGGSGSSGAVGSGAAAVESAAVSVIVPRAVVRVGALVGWDGCEVRLCVRLPEWSRLPPVSEAEIRSRTWQKWTFFSERAAGEENLHVMATHIK